MIKFLRCLLLLAVLFVNRLEALDNGLARTPPMGFMHWQRYRCITDCGKYPDECISENLFKKISDLMVSEGYAEAGYEYVIIDDCWLESERDKETNRLVPDRNRFPSGLHALADYIHGKGLKFGLYEDYGTNTCAGYPGVINYMELDAQTFADWDVDYVKLDGCYANVTDMDYGYPAFGNFLNKTGRPMVYSCSWPVYQEYEGIIPNYESMKEHCNLWRNWDDIQDSYQSLASIMDYFAKNQDRIQPHGGPGHWNDPDMLLLGNYGLSYDQSKVQMAVWAIMAAPLLLSTDLAAVRPEIKKIIQNRDIIAVNQDPSGIQGRRVAVKNDIEVWARPIEPVNRAGEYSYAVAFVSRRTDGAPYSIKFSLQDLRLGNRGGYNVVDLFEDSAFVGFYENETNSISKTDGHSGFETRINPLGVQFFKFTAV